MLYELSKISWVFLAPTNLLIGLVGAGSLLLVFYKARWLSAAVAASGLLLMVLNFTPAWKGMAEPLEARFQKPSLNGQDFAAIVALGGDVSRLQPLAALGNRFPKARLIYSGALCSEACVREQFVNHGGNANRLIVETASRSTAENAFNVASLIAPHAAQSVLLVTSSLHMPRAVGAFRAQGVSVTAYPVFPVRQYRFFHGAKSLRMTDLVAKEWIGLIAYRVAGRSNSIFPGPEVSKPGSRPVAVAHNESR